jgi:hypothetical protein
MKQRFGAMAALSLVVSLGLGTAVQAQSVRDISTFRDWHAYSAGEAAGKLCFALSRPTDVSPTPDGFTKAYLYLTRRAGETIAYEFSLVSGFTFAPDSMATVTVGGDSFQLFTENDGAWLDDNSQSERLASVIRAGSSLTIEGTSDKGIRVKQTFSLSGATAASKAITAECPS